MHKQINIKRIHFFVLPEGISTLCGECLQRIHNNFNNSFEVDVGYIFTKGHFFVAHLDYGWELTKSKLRGPFRDPAFLQEFVEHFVRQRCGAPLQHWVHEITGQENQVFGFRFIMENRTRHPDDAITGAFVRDGRLWQQRRLEAWFNSYGQLSAIFPCGGCWHGGEWRPFTPLTADWTMYPNSRQCCYVRECKFIFFLQIHII